MSEKPLTKKEIKRKQKEEKKAAKAEKGTGIVSAWTFIGLTILFCLPVIGFICEIVFTFAPKKYSLRNFSLACLVFRIIGILIFMLLAVLAIIAIVTVPELGSVVDAIKDGSAFKGSIFKGSFFDGRFGFEFKGLN